MSIFSVFVCPCVPGRFSHAKIYLLATLTVFPRNLDYFSYIFFTEEMTNTGRQKSKKLKIHVAYRPIKINFVHAHMELV